MTVKVISEQEVLEEASQVLLTHLGPAKFARFLAASRIGGGDYLAIRDRLFGQESVNALADEVEEYQKKDNGRVPGT